MYKMYIILPTAYMGSSLTLIVELYRGVTMPMCNDIIEGIRRDRDEVYKCRGVGADQYCIGEKASTEVCGESKYFDIISRFWNYSQSNNHNKTIANEIDKLPKGSRQN